MKKNPIETILGVFVLFFAVVFLIYASSRVDTKKVDGYQVRANFSKIGGLEIGSDVRISGIKVGVVLDTNLTDDYTADVVLSIDSAVQLPIDTEATIADVGLMGGKYVRLTPGKASVILKPGEYLTKTQNYKSLEDSISEFIFLSTK